MKGIILFSNKLKEAWLAQEKHKKVLSEVGGLEVFCNQIIKEVNFVNSKYNVTEVKFVNIDEIPELFYLGSQAAGYIVEERDRKYILNAYICITNPDMGSRNAIGAQQLFPALSKLVEKYINSPGYELANLPIYFLYGSKDSMTDSIKQSIIAMELIGVKCIPLFNKGTFLTEDIRLRLTKEFRQYSHYNLWEYANLLAKEKNDDNNDEIKTDYFIVNRASKTLKFINKSFANGDLGSRDRFFVIKAYPALILADNLKYNIELDEMVQYVENHSCGNSNFNPFIHYAKKLIGRSAN